jgi:hypothetical protein
MIKPLRRDGFPDLILILLIGIPIAAFYPFDVIFNAATGGSAALRAALFVVLALSGTLMGNRVGLTVHPYGARSPALIGVGAAVLVAVAIALLDGVIWRQHLPPGYLRIFQTVGLTTRLAGFMLRAFNENVLYRLFLFSSLALLLGRVWPDSDGRPAPGAMWLAMILAQTVNIGTNIVAFAPDGVVPADLLYDAIRYIAPGVLSAQLYRYYGFATTEIASVGCHVILQPALGYLLRPSGA